MNEYHRGNTAEIKGRSIKLFIAWVIPNTAAAKRKMLDGCIVSIAEIEKRTGEVIPVLDYVKHDKPRHSWMIPRGCNKG